MMDINMPGINGIEGLRLSADMIADINVIMLTIFDDDDKFSRLSVTAPMVISEENIAVKILESISEVYNGGAPMTSSIARRILQLFPKLCTQ
jgi:DNA-binding NarL/FixJ family response regulator